MSEPEQKSFTEIGLFIPPSFDEVKGQWPRSIPLTHEIYERVIDLMELEGVTVQEAYRQIQEEDGKPDHPWS